MEVREQLIRIISLMLIFIIITLSGCVEQESNNDSHNLLKNEKLKEQAFEQIINNEDLFNEFLDRMHGNTQSMVWMMDHENMMQSMYTLDNMEYVMKHHDMYNHMMDNMMHVLTKDSTNARKWEDMMKSHREEHYDSHMKDMEHHME